MVNQLVGVHFKRIFWRSLLFKNLFWANLCSVHVCKHCKCPQCEMPSNDMSLLNALNGCKCECQPVKQLASVEQ